MRRFASDAGVALVEFALVAPVLILLLVGILDVARGVNAYITLSNAAREGAHYAALHPTADPSAITAAVRARVVPLDAAAASVQPYYYDGSAFQPWPATGIPASSPEAAYVTTRVRVTYPWSAVTVLIGAFFSSSPMTTSSSMDTIR